MLRTSWLWKVFIPFPWSHPCVHVFHSFTNAMVPGRPTEESQLEDLFRYMIRERMVIPHHRGSTKGACLRSPL